MPAGTPRPSYCHRAQEGVSWALSGWVSGPRWRSWHAYNIPSSTAESVPPHDARVGFCSTEWGHQNISPPVYFHFLDVQALATVKNSAQIKTHMCVCVCVCSAQVCDTRKCAQSGSHALHIKTAWYVGIFFSEKWNPLGNSNLSSNYDIISYRDSGSSQIAKLFLRCEITAQRPVLDFTETFRRIICWSSNTSGFSHMTELNYLTYIPTTPSTLTSLRNAQIKYNNIPYSALCF